MVDAYGSEPYAPYTGVEVQILSPALERIEIFAGMAKLVDAQS